MEKHRQWNNKVNIRVMILFVLIAVVITSICACGWLDSTSWKEEVLLHDGSKIIVKRWQKQMRNLGQKSLIEEQSISFKLPGQNKKITWKDGPTKDIRSANFHLIAMHIKDNVPYIIATAYGCLSYNKWDRPNPPYVIFKFDGNEWQRIPLPDLPLEFVNVNLIINSTGHEEQNAARQGVVYAEDIKELNKSLVQKEYKSIARTPLVGVGCEGMIYDGSGWRGVDYSKMKVSYKRCIELCKKMLSNMKYCPCDKYFSKDSLGE